MNEFKVGDWITISKGRAWRATEFDVAHFELDEDIELWHPKDGEWVIVSSHRNDFLQFFFAVHKWSDELKEALTKNNIFEWVYEPFIGELPSFLEDKR